MQFAQYYRDFNGPMMDGWNRGDYWGHALVGFVFFIILVGLAVYLIRTVANHGNTQSETRDPLEIAKERYAKGEITKEEFTDIKKELK
jgi:putative membrane protein